MAHYQLKILSGQFFHFIDDYHLLNGTYRALQSDHFDLKRDYEKLTNRLRSRRNLFKENAERLRLLQTGLKELVMAITFDSRDSDNLQLLITSSRLDDSISVL